MKKITKTAEEIKRDELVITTRKAKEKVEYCVRVINRRQKAMAMLPQESTEYEVFEDDVTEDKWSLAFALRDYDRIREELGKHCRDYHLAGNTFLSGYELLEILVEKN
jgi:nucleoid-associated protein YejK